MSTYLAPRAVAARSVTYHHAHRIAAKSLFRALVEQCKAVPLEKNKQETLQNVVRWQFQKNRHLHMLQHVNLRFQVGYTALDILDKAATGEANSLDRVSRFAAKFERGYRYYKRFLRRQRLATRFCWKQQRLSLGFEPTKTAATAGRKRSTTLSTTTNGILFDMFPRKTVTGIRRPPTLINAAGYPVLRYSKPQPLAVSRMVQSFHKKRNLRIHWLSSTQSFHLPLAQMEDQWETHLEKIAGFKDPSAEPSPELKSSESQSSANSTFRPTEPISSSSWTDEYRRQLVQSRDSIRWWNTVVQDKARKLYHIVLQEKQLAVEEAEARERQEKGEVQGKGSGLRKVDGVPREQFRAKRMPPVQPENEPLPRERSERSRRWRDDDPPIARDTEYRSVPGRQSRNNIQKPQPKPSFTPRNVRVGFSRRKQGKPSEEGDGWDW